MARNWLESGERLIVYDLDPSLPGHLQSQGAQAAASAAEVVQQASIVVSVLPNDHILKSSFLEGGLLHQMRSDAVHLSCSTVSPATAREMGAAHVKHSAGGYVSAPVFARPDGMARREACIPVSGPSAAVQRCIPLLQKTAKAGVFEFGEDPGAANMVKLCGNFLIAAAIESMAESLALAEKEGVDRVKVMQMLNSTIFDCLIYKGYGQRVSERDHTPHPNAHFALELGLKDVSLVTETAAKAGCPMPIASLLKDRFISAKAHGWEHGLVSHWSAVLLGCWHGRFRSYDQARTEVSGYCVMYDGTHSPLRSEWRWLRRILFQDPVHYISLNCLVRVSSTLARLVVVCGSVPSQEVPGTSAHISQVPGRSAHRNMFIPNGQATWRNGWTEISTS